MMCYYSKDPVIFLIQTEFYPTMLSDLRLQQRKIFIFTNKSFVTERDQRPRRSFDTKLKECQSYSPKQITLLKKILRTQFKYGKSTNSYNSKSMHRVMVLVHCTSPQ